MDIIVIIAMFGYNVVVSMWKENKKNGVYDKTYIIWSHRIDRW